MRLRATVTSMIGLILFAATSAGTQATAQSTPSLIADRVTTTPTTLIAEGNVTVFIDGQKLSAQRIVYLKPEDRIEISGSVTIEAEDGTVLRAQSGSLDRRTQTLLLQQTRLLLEQRVQITAGALKREGGLSAMRHVGLTSCTVCPGQQPLWAIHADALTHSEDARRIWLSAGSSRIKGTSILPTPALSLPAPGNTRDRGLLRPSLGRNASAGPFVRLPYFLPLSDYRDVTFTPIIGRSAQTLDLTYRQRFRHGDIKLEGLISDAKSLKAGAWARLSASFTLPYNVSLSADVETISDSGFRRRFNHIASDNYDPLDHSIKLVQILPRSRTELAYTLYTPTHDSLSAQTHHRDLLQGKLDLRRPVLGGFAYGRLRGLGYRRDLAVSAPGSFDQSLLSAELGWRGRTILSGFELGAQTALSGAVFTTREQTGTTSGAFSGSAASLSVAYPLRSQSWGTQTLTPRMTLSWAKTNGALPKGDDAALPELDELTLHRFDLLPGETQSAQGLRLGASLAWQGKFGAHSTYATLGRIWQKEPAASAPSSGLDTRRSDWTLALGADGPLGTSGTARYELDARLAVDPKGLTHSDLRAALRWDKLDLSLKHSFIAQDASRGRGHDLQMIDLASTWRVNDTLSLNVSGLYDISLNEPRRAKIGLDWRNECLRFAVSASRKFISSVNTKADTQYGFELTIDGFSTSGRTRIGTCSN